MDPLFTPQVWEEGDYVLVELPVYHDYVIVEAEPVEPVPLPVGSTVVERVYTFFLNCREAQLFYWAYRAANPIQLGSIAFRNSVVPLAALTGTQGVVDGAQILSDGVALALDPVRFVGGRVAYWSANRLSQGALRHYHPEIQGLVRVIIRANRTLIIGDGARPAFLN